MAVPRTKGYLTVIDPLSRKIDIPIHCIQHTKALTRDVVPSLCMLFLEGRCRQGVDCNQIHADQETVLEIREAASRLPTCCKMHGDINAAMFDRFPHWSDKTLIVDSVPIPMERVAFTNGLERCLDNEQTSGGTVAMSPTFICRLQAGGHCRYSEECKFVHVCTEITKHQLSHCVAPLKTDLERKHKDHQTPSSLASSGRNSNRGSGRSTPHSASGNTTPRNAGPSIPSSMPTYVLSNAGHFSQAPILEGQHTPQPMQNQPQQHQQQHAKMQFQPAPQFSQQPAPNFQPYQQQNVQQNSQEDSPMQLCFIPQGQFLVPHMIPAPPTQQQQRQPQQHQGSTQQQFQPAPPAYSQVVGGQPQQFQSPNNFGSQFQVLQPFSSQQPFGGDQRGYGSQQQPPHYQQQQQPQYVLVQLPPGPPQPLQ